MIFDWQFAWETLPKLLSALTVTVAATALGMAVALVLGLALALARRSQSQWLSWSTAGFIEFTRSTPLLVQIYFLFYILPDTGLRLSAFATGVIALGLHYAAYCSEVYRAGFDGVPRSQWEAASALNLSRYHTIARIIVPQAIPPVVPALGNYLVAMFKDTPMLSAITVLELLQTGKVVGAETFRYLEPLTLVGALFLVLSLMSAAGIRAIERRLQKMVAQ